MDGRMAKFSFREHFAGLRQCLQKDFLIPPGGGRVLWFVAVSRVMGINWSKSLRATRRVVRKVRIF